MTVSELRKYLSAFPGDTVVVLGQVDTYDVIKDWRPNTYYPPDLSETLQVVLDPARRRLTYVFQLKRDIWIIRVDWHGRQAHRARTA